MRRSSAAGCLRSLCRTNIFKIVVSAIGGRLPVSGQFVGKRSLSHALVARGVLVPVNDNALSFWDSEQNLYGVEDIVDIQRHLLRYLVVGGLQFAYENGAVAL